jgi:hypothetical protein
MEVINNFDTHGNFRIIKLILCKLYLFSYFLNLAKYFNKLLKINIVIK